MKLYENLKIKMKFKVINIFKDVVFQYAAKMHLGSKQIYTKDTYYHNESHTCITYL